MGWLSVRPRKTILNFLRDKLDIESFKQKIRGSSYINDDDIDSKLVECGAIPNDRFMSLDVSKNSKRDFQNLVVILVGKFWN